MVPIHWFSYHDGTIAVASSDLPRTSHVSFPSRVASLLNDPVNPGSWGARYATDVAVVFPWLSLATQVADKHSLPVAWLLAFVYAESRGKQDALSSDGGVGLMQITHPSLKGSYTTQELLDPELNLTLGARVLSNHARGVSVFGLPGLASCYNAGGKSLGVPHTSDASPWGMRETRGYISRVVAASNALFQAMREGVCKPS